MHVHHLTNHPTCICPSIHPSIMHVHHLTKHPTCICPSSIPPSIMHVHHLTNHPPIMYVHHPTTHHAWPSSNHPSNIHLSIHSSLHDYLPAADPASPSDPGWSLGHLVTTGGSLIGPNWQLKVPTGQSDPEMPPAAPAGQTAACRQSAGDSGEERLLFSWHTLVFAEAPDWRCFKALLTNESGHDGRHTLRWNHSNVSIWSDLSICFSSQLRPIISLDLEKLEEIVESSFFHIQFWPSSSPGPVVSGQRPAPRHRHLQDRRSASTRPHSAESAAVGTNSQLAGRKPPKPAGGADSSAAAPPTPPTPLPSWTTTGRVIDRFIDWWTEWLTEDCLTCLCVCPDARREQRRQQDWWRVGGSRRFHSADPTRSAMMMSHHGEAAFNDRKQQTSVFKVYSKSA